jgi:hypothetical protein
MHDGWSLLKQNEAEEVVSTSKSEDRIGMRAASASERSGRGFLLECRAERLTTRRLAKRLATDLTDCNRRSIKLKKKISISHADSADASQLHDQSKPYRSSM